MPLYCLPRITPQMATKSGNNEYSLRTSHIECGLASYAYDLVVIANKLKSVQLQLNKLDKYYEWARVDLDISKCTINQLPQHIKTKPTSLPNTNTSHKYQLHKPINTST